MPRFIRKAAIKMINKWKTEDAEAQKSAQQGNQQQSPPRGPNITPS